MNRKGLPVIGDDVDQSLIPWDSLEHDQAEDLCRLPEDRPLGVHPIAQREPAALREEWSDSLAACFSSDLSSPHRVHQWTYRPPKICLVGHPHPCGRRESGRKHRLEAARRRTGWRVRVNSFIVQPHRLCAAPARSAGSNILK